MRSMGADHFDVLIIGAGLSGIDAAYHLQKYCSNKTYVILEQRERIGGTWDLIPVSRHPLRFRHADHGLFVPPMDQSQSNRPRGRHSRLRHCNCSRRRHRPAHSLPPHGPKRGVVLAKCELDGECNLPARGRPRRASHSDLQLFVFLCGLLSLQRRVPAGVSRHRDASRVASFTRKRGRKIWTMPASASSSSAVERPP